MSDQAATKTRKPRSDNMAILGFGPLKNATPEQLLERSNQLDARLKANEFTEENNALHLAKFYRSKFKYMAKQLAAKQSVLQPEAAVATAELEQQQSTPEGVSALAAMHGISEADAARMRSIGPELASGKKLTTKKPKAKRKLKEEPQMNSAGETVLRTPQEQIGHEADMAASIVDHPSAIRIKRISAFKNLANNAWYGKIYAKLTASEVKLCLSVLETHGKLDPSLFEDKVNRLFLNVEAADLPKHWKEMTELLQVANTGEPEAKV